MIFNFKQFVNEMKIYKKPPYTLLGFNHKIFASKNPGMIYKVGYLCKVKKWLPIFKEHPDLFPIIYKTGNFIQEDEKCMWVLLEKLNTDQVLMEWEQLTDCLEDLIPRPGYYDDDDPSDLREVFKIVNTDKDYIEYLCEYLNPNEDDNENYLLFLKWVKFFEKLSFLGNKLDIHKYQYGYDKYQNIKCFDI